MDWRTQWPLLGAPDFAFHVGDTVPLRYDAVSYAGFTPTSAAGLSFRVVVRESTNDTTAAAVLDVTDPAGITVTDAGEQLDLAIDWPTTGLRAGQLYFVQVLLLVSGGGRYTLDRFACSLLPNLAT